MTERVEASAIPEERVTTITSLAFENLRTKLQTGELTATEVLRAYQHKALQVHALTNCLTEPILEAEALAEACDAMTGEKGSLHGIPVSLKEVIGLGCYDCTGGMVELIGHPYPQDCTLVQQLKREGAVPFVRTNVPQTGMSFDCSNPIYGATRNPLDTSRSPGGSSGGECALIAGGGSILGIGTDNGGSTRIPAHFCGISGFRPTCGRLSNKGSLCLNRGQTLVKATAGPMGRDVASLIQAMESLSSPLKSELDPKSPSVPFKLLELNEKRPLRIGYFYDDGYYTPDPACQRAVQEAKEILESQGHELLPWSLPRNDDVATTCMISCSEDCTTKTIAR